jgi:hypothetical protein
MAVMSHSTIVKPWSAAFLLLIILMTRLILGHFYQKYIAYNICGFEK